MLGHIYITRACLLFCRKHLLLLALVVIVEYTTVQLRCKVNEAHELLVNHAQVTRRLLTSRSRVTRNLLALPLALHPSVYYKTYIAISHLL